MDPVAARVAARWRAANMPCVEIGYGAVAARLSFQGDFPYTTSCDCGKSARLALAVREVGGPGRVQPRYVLHENPNDGGVWPHDCAAFAIYLCSDVKCGRAVALWNEA